jgi:chemotaxis protein MotB
MDNKKEEAPKPRRRVKKVRGHGGHHGGAWKVAYADFVTAMMALFLVLWLVSQADVELKQQIASYFRNPGVFDSTAGGILSQAKKVSKEPTTQTSKDNEQALFSVAQTLQKQFGTRPEFSRYKDRVQIDVTDEGLRIQMIDEADKVSFQSGSADLGEDAKAVLAEIAGGICTLPNKINIGGHTDSRVFPSNTGYTNWELSADRANAARRTLEANCVKPEQIRRIVGFADTELLVPNDPYSPSNRRISITVLRLVPAEPEAEDGKKKETSGKETGSDESKLAEKKLETEGSVVVGEADPVPDKPKIK